jgi:succinylarginine dihydrolase
MSTDTIPITERGCAEANLVRRMRSNLALSKRLTSIKLFGQQRSAVAEGDPACVQVLLTMAEEFEQQVDPKLRVQLLGAMATLSGSLDASDQKLFDSMLKAVLAKDKKDRDAGDYTEAELERASKGDA